MKVGEYEIREGIYYTKDNEWAKIENGNCKVGIDDYAQQKLHEIVFVDLPKIGLKILQMESLGTVESVKAVADVYSPVSGEVIEVNEKLRDNPELINKNPYDDGWIAAIKTSKLQDDMKNMMDAKAYSEFLKTQAEKEH